MSNNRIKDTDITSAMVKLDVTRRLPADKTIVLTFTMIGKHDDLVNEYGEPDANGYPILYDKQDENGNVIEADILGAACAKAVYMVEKIFYYIKQDNFGKFYNPNGMYVELSHSKFKHSIMGEKWKFKLVNKSVFINYLSFLKTNNMSWLNNAQREAI